METSDVISASREVLYGGTESNEPATIQSMYKLLIGINGRLGKIEEKMTSIDKLNDTIASLSSDVSKLKLKVGTIDGSIGKLEKNYKTVESEMNTLKACNSRMGRELQDLNKNLCEHESNLQGMSNIMDKYAEKQDTNIKETSSIKTSISKVANDLEDHNLELKQEIKSVLSDIRNENEELKSDIIDLKCRSMKNNLIFNGLREPEGENTENLLRQFIRTELNIKHRMEFGNVHRFGRGAKPGKRGRPRPIVARFIYHNDKAYVLSNAFRLKGKGYSIKQQFPEVIEQARMSLYSVMQQKRAEGHRVHLDRDVLWVDNEIYQEDGHQDSYSEAPHRPQARANGSDFRTPNRHDGNRVKKRRITSTPS